MAGLARLILLTRTISSRGDSSAPRGDEITCRGAGEVNGHEDTLDEKISLCIVTFFVIFIKLLRYYIRSGIL